MSQFFFHHFHTHEHHYSEYNQVFYSRTIRALAMSLVSIFIPIYLVEISGGSLENAFPLIVLFYVGEYGLRFLLSPLGGWLVSRIGAKHVLTISAFTNSLSLLFLAYLDGNTWMLIPAAFLQGVNMSLFFTALHVEMSTAMAKRKGRQVSTVEIARKLAMALGPLVGGVIAGTVGIFYGFIASIVMMAVSTLTLRLNDEPTIPKHPFRWRGLLEVRPRMHLLANVGMGMNMVSAAQLWPLFIFVLVGTYEKVGVVITLSLAFSIFLMRFVGVHDSDRSVKSQLRLSAGGTAVTHAVRPIATSLGAITGVNVLNDIAFSGLVIPYMSTYYKRADEVERIAYVSMMEVAFGLGAGLAWLLVFVAFILTSATTALVVGFILGAIGSLMGQYIKK